MDDEPDLPARLTREVDRVGDRLRSLSLARLDRGGPDGATPAGRAHALAQQLADLAADAQGRPRRPVPRLPSHGAADQVVVTGHDVLAEGDEGAQRAALDALVTLRHAL